MQSVRLASLVLAFALLPQMSQARTIMEVLEQDNRFSRLVELLRESSLDQLAGGRGTYTLFAPTDRAFAAMGPASLDALRKAEHNQAQIDWVGRLLVAGVVVEEADGSSQVEKISVSGSPIKIQGPGIRAVNGVPVSADIISADNGTIYVINQVP